MLSRHATGFISQRYNLLMHPATILYRPLFYPTIKFTFSTDLSSSGTDNIIFHI